MLPLRTAAAAAVRQKSAAALPLQMLLERKYRIADMVHLRQRIRRSSSIYGQTCCSHPDDTTQTIVYTLDGPYLRRRPLTVYVK